jgi:hypothetical protein
MGVMSDAAGSNHPGEEMLQGTGVWQWREQQKLSPHQGSAVSIIATI